MVGTTRSRVSFFMNKFRKLGFIEYNGDLKVHNSLLNVILHDDPGPKREPTRSSNPTDRPAYIRAGSARRGTVTVTK